MTRHCDIDLNHFRYVTEYSKALDCIRHMIWQARHDYSCLADNYEDHDEELDRLYELASTLFVKYRGEATFLENLIFNRVKDNEYHQEQHKKEDQ